MNRLVGYYHREDPQCLDQAVSVARRQEIDLAKVEAWSERERSLPKFRRFRDRLLAATAADLDQSDLLERAFEEAGPD
jgi:hypothetical protein